MMKKVTMLVMAMALVVPALGLVIDNPPAWAGGANTTTAVWDFSEYDEIPIDDWGNNVESTCLDGPCSWLSPIFDGYFDAEAGELSSSLWYSVGLPDAPGEYVTTRTQVHLADGSDIPAWAEFQHQSGCSEAADTPNCAWSNDPYGDPELVVEDNVVIITRTVPRYDFMECGEIVATGGFVQGAELDVAGDRRYTALVVDVIVHDGEEPPEDGPRVSTCFADPTIVVGGGEVAEEGETSAVVPIQLYTNPSAPVTITIAEPVWEVDPNFSDPEAFTITGAVDGVATVIIPADSNSASITVTAIDDSVIEGNLGYGLVVESTMAPGAGYDPNFVTGPAEDPNSTALVSAGSVTVIDNDVRNVLVDPDFVELSENDPNVWVCVDVTLSHEPEALVNVAVEMAEFAWDVGMVETDADLEDPNALQFNAGNWNIPQQICFAAIDNGELAEFELSHVPAVCTLIPASEDAGYDPETGIDPQAVINLSVEEKACGGRGLDFRDINEDCYVTVDDLAIFVESWLNCTDAKVEGCIE